ncbi:hypothetical protein D3C84_874490 [compost metagenome]
MRARGGLQQCFSQQRLSRRLLQAVEAGEVRAEHRANALLGQHMNLHVRRPRWLGKHQQGVQPRAARVEIAFSGRQVQAQLRQVRLQPAQPRDEPACQQATGTAEDERRIGAALAQFGAHPAQTLERVAAGIA